MRILFDQGTPVPIRYFLQEHVVRTAADEGWATLKNGELLEAAERANFHLFLTPDKNIRYQQNLSRRTIAIVLLSNAQWPTLHAHLDLVVNAVNSSGPGTYVEVQIPLTK